MIPFFFGPCGKSIPSIATQRYGKINLSIAEKYVEKVFVSFCSFWLFVLQRIFFLSKGFDFLWVFKIIKIFKKNLIFNFKEHFHKNFIYSKDILY